MESSFSIRTPKSAICHSREGNKFPKGFDCCRDIVNHLFPPRIANSYLGICGTTMVGEITPKCFGKYRWREALKSGRSHG